MMEIVQKCQNPTTSAEEHSPYPKQAPVSNPMPSGESDLNSSQEMQWSLAKEDFTCSDPSLSRQAFLTPPQDLGWDLSKSPPLDTGFPCEEMDHPELLGQAERLSGGFKEEPDRWPCERTPREGLIFQKTRLPSIVVEPSEGSDGESGELLWPPEGFPLLEGDEPDKFLADEEEEEEELEAEFSSFENDMDDVLL